MRIGIVVDLKTVALADVPGLAEQTEAAGLDLLWLRSGDTRPAEALAAAASCSSVAPALQIGAQVHVDGTHPVYLAEERNVVDQLLGGRLVLALSHAGPADTLAEWTEVLLAAASTVPFRHVGDHPVPAGLPENSINPEEQVVVTPQPFGLDPQVWVSGPGATQVAGDYGLSLLAESLDGHPQWRDLEAALGRRALRLRRPGILAWDPAAEDARELADRLTGERDTSGLDTVMVDLTCRPGTTEWRRALAELASVVRPRVQMHRLPDGLEDFWDRERHSGPHRQTTGENDPPTTSVPPVDREAMT